MATLLRAERTFLYGSIGEDLDEMKSSFGHSAAGASLEGIPGPLYRVDERIPAVKLRKFLSRSDQDVQQNRKRFKARKPLKKLPENGTDNSFQHLTRSRSMLDVKEAREAAQALRELTALNSYRPLWKAGSSQSISGYRRPSVENGFSSPIHKEPNFGSMPAKINMVAEEVDHRPKGSRHQQKELRLPRIDGSMSNTPIVKTGPQGNEGNSSDSDYEDSDSRNAEKEVNADWVLEEKIKEQQRIFERRRNQLLIKKGNCHVRS